MMLLLWGSLSSKQKINTIVIDDELKIADGSIPFYAFYKRWMESKI